MAAMQTRGARRPVLVRPPLVLLLALLCALAAGVALGHTPAAAQAPDDFDDLDNPNAAFRIVIDFDPGWLQVWTDSFRYAVGDPIVFCYTVPIPGEIAIYDYLPNGLVNTLVAGYDNGWGDCLTGVITPPGGRECLRIRFFFVGGGSVSRATCFEVLGGGGPITGGPPSGGTPPTGMMPPTGGPAGAPAAGGLTADYRFQGTLASAAGNAPALTALAAGTQFATERVDGVNRSVLAFPAATGLSLASARSVIPADTYTVVALFRFAEIGGYRRILDVKNGTTDNGLYNRDGKLVYYGAAGGEATPIAANTYVQVVLTRSSGGEVVGYVNGVRQFSFNDSGGGATISTDNVLRFFRDDGAENGAGAVARIRLYNRALTPNEVAGLDR